jgi:hypothetical protein
MILRAAICGGVLALISAGTAIAECVGSTTPITDCNRCTAKGEIVVTRDKTCSRSFRAGGADAIILGTAVVKKARHGRVGVTTGGWAYIPPRGFVGRDAFTVSLTRRLGRAETIVTYLEVDVNVVP